MHLSKWKKTAHLNNIRGNKMSIYKRECWLDYSYKGRFFRKTFDNHLDRKQWTFKLSLDNRYQVLIQSK